MTQLGTGPPAAETQQPAEGIRRSRDDKVIAGVCGGLGRSFGIDPIWFRLAFVVLTVGGGAGVLLYILAWIIIPEQGENEVLAPRSAVLAKDGPLIGGALLVGVGLMLLLDNVFPWFDRVMWPSLVIVAGIGLIYAGRRHGRA